MNCPKCGAPVSAEMVYCAACGATLPQSDPAVMPGTVTVPGAPVALDFTGSALGLFGWLLALLVGTIFVIPLAWATAGVARWFCRHTTFSDGTTAEFRGTGGQIAIWSILYVLVLALQQFLLNEVEYEGLVAVFAVMLGSMVVLLAIVLTILKWFVFNVTLRKADGSPAPDIAFEGSYGGLLGWYLLTAASVYTVVGWAWAVAGMYRWMASQVKGRGVRFSFHGKGHEILWRILVAVLGSALIIPIPWLYLWVTRWLIQNIRMEYKEELDLASLAEGAEAG